jgi:hypothetical protein
MRLLYACTACTYVVADPGNHEGIIAGASGFVGVYIRTTSKITVRFGLIILVTCSSIPGVPVPSPRPFVRAS